MEAKEIKEAIMFLENTLYFCIGEEDDMPEYQSKYNHWVKKIITLLKELDTLKKREIFGELLVDEKVIQGEKYRQIWEELKEKLSQNPYPEDIFTPIPKEDFNKINELLKKEMGYPIDKLSGNIGRKIYKSIIDIIEEAKQDK